MVSRIVKKRLALVALALVVLVLALAAAALALIDALAVQAELRSRLSRAIDGEVAWDSLDIGLLPPRAELRRLRVEMPHKLSANAEQAQVHLRFWPLLRGSVEIASVAVDRPQVRVEPGEGGGGSADPLALYQAVMRPTMDALREHASDMRLRIDGAAFDFGTFQLRNLTASARTGTAGVELQASAGSNIWKQLSVAGRIEYADLAARADIALDALVVDKDVPPASLRAKVRTDAKTAIESEFDASLGSVAQAKGKALLTPGKPLQVEAQVDSVDVAQAIAIAQRKAPGLDVIESAEGRLSAKAAFILGSPWELGVQIVQSDATVKLAPLPWKLAAHAGRVTVTPQQVHLGGVKGSLGDSVFQGVAAQIDLGDKPRLAAGSGKASARLEQWVPWLRTKVALEEIQSASGEVEIDLHRLALRFDRPQEVDFDATATPRKASAVLKLLPGAVGVDGGSVRVDRKEVALKNVGATLLDARSVVSGKYSLKDSRLELNIAQGVTGEKLVRWALERGAVPARFEPKTPLRFTAQRIAWAPKRALEVDARVEFERGPALAAALAWRPEVLELRRVVLKDARSDAVFGATVAADLIQAGFSGTLHGESIPAMLRQPLPAGSGTAQGELRLTIDRQQPARTSGEGRLRVEALDLSWLAGAKAVIERAEIVAERTGVRIPGARFGWEDQFFELRGEGRRTAAGPVIEARIESDGVALDRLLPPPDPNAPRKKSSALWPLPLSGRIELRTAFVQYKDYRIEPFDGVVSLEPERARLEVKEARMCGLSFPMELEMQPEQGVAAAHIRMKNEPLERTVRCLTGGNVELTGNADLVAELRIQGRRPHLVRGLTGTLDAQVREGRVKKFALIGNILSIRDIASLGKMQEDGFPYRNMTAKGHFEGGRFVVEEAFFDSDAARLAASGHVDLLGANSQLTVLVGLLTTIDRIAEAVPILGDVFGGSMTALPMSVTGDIRDPFIVPLGPRAVSEHLLGIFERTLKLPGKLLVHPDAKNPAPK